ncbi:MAG: glycine cleavage system aminomethyltransferase GcvT [Thermoproteales archaeon]|nr:glycine cleavage system aminomethyltransferase GcvT [Thermoproteales archaeon]
MGIETPLLSEHEKLGAEIGVFAGWRTAMVFSSALKEALDTRTKATVFDVSHMARILVKGEDAEELLEYLIPRFIAKAPAGRMIGPSALLNENAGFKDDVMVYKIDGSHFLIVGNAVNRKKDLEWILHVLGEKGLNVHVEDLTEETAMLALQGPQTPEVLEKLVGVKGDEMGMLEFKSGLNTTLGRIWILSKSGWTGEPGFEIISSIEVIKKIWKALIEKGVEPAGLGARDILRIEMGFCLYGHEINEHTTPLEARYKVFSNKKRGYIGYDALHERYRRGVERLRYGLLLNKGSPIPREGTTVYAAEVRVGEVTSGTFSPFLKRPIAEFYVQPSHAYLGFHLEVEIRGKKYTAKIVDFPFVKK